MLQQAYDDSVVTARARMGGYLPDPDDTLEPLGADVRSDLFTPIAAGVLAGVVFVASVMLVSLQAAHAATPDLPDHVVSARAGDLNENADRG